MGLRTGVSFSCNSACWQGVLGYEWDVGDGDCLHVFVVVLRNRGAPAYTAHRACWLRACWGKGCEYVVEQRVVSVRSGLNDAVVVGLVDGVTLVGLWAGVSHSCLLGSWCGS